MKDYYYILGVERNATKREIQLAYKKLHAKFHPDNNDGDRFFETHFREIREAYETLVDASKRAAYNQQLRGENPMALPENRLPIIYEFSSSKKAVKSGDLLTLTWRVAHADRVFIEQIGKVEPTGTKTIRLAKLDKVQDVEISLRATNTMIGESVSKTLSLHNKDLDLPDFETKYPKPKPKPQIRQQPKPSPKKTKSRPKPQPTPENKPKRSQGSTLYAYSIIFVLVLLIIFLAYIIYKLNKLS